MGSHLSIITLNVNALNTWTRRQSLAEWIQKQDPCICCLQETISSQGTYTDWKWKAGKKIFHANEDQKKAGEAILISDKIDFEIKTVKRDKEGHYIMIKGSIQEEDITIINIYAPNTEKAMAPHSSILAWRIPGTGSLVGCHLWGRTESDTTEAT